MLWLWVVVRYASSLVQYKGRVGLASSKKMEGSSNISLGARFLEGFDWSKRDRRLDGLPLMSSIWPIIFIVTCYAFLGLVAGPRFMRDRSPFKLEIFGLVFNTYQFLAEFALIPWVGMHYFANGNGWGEYIYICIVITTHKYSYLW